MRFKVSAKIDGSELRKESISKGNTDMLNAKNNDARLGEKIEKGLRNRTKLT